MMQQFSTRLKMLRPYEKYTLGDYLRNNPTWDIEDSAWKAVFVAEVLRDAEIKPNSICDVGCGAGGVLVELRRSYPKAELYGYDVAPDAARFWLKHEQANINFFLGDFSALNKQKYDVLLLLDVIEHVADPFAFLSDIRGTAQHYVFHIPLDLSMISVIREKPILRARRKVGHIHYFTKNLALSLLKECGYDVIGWRYSGAGLNAPRRTWKTILASVPRRLGYALNKDWGVLALGGETIFVLARVKTGSCDRGLGSFDHC